MSLGLRAQSSGCNSPYSRYGWGNLSDVSDGFNKGMAGAGLGTRSSRIINHQNPASYSAIDSVTFIFDAGLSLTTGHWKEGSAGKTALNTTLDYAEAGFRLAKGVGLSVGLRPVTLIGYNFSASQTMEDIDGYGEKTATSTFLGEGGTRKVYVGMGAELFRNLSIGFNAGYLWGDYKHNSAMTFSESSIQRLARLYKGTINTYTLDAGIQFTQPLSKQDALTLGLTFGLGHKFKGSSTFINQKKTSSSVIGADTTTVSNAYEMPASFGAGLTYRHGDRLTVAADYTLDKWKGCRYPGLTTDGDDAAYEVGTNSFCNRSRFALGAEYLPNPDGLHFKDHVAYRLGFAYSTPYYKVNGADGPKSFLVTAGVGLPIVNAYNRRSNLNIAFQWQHVSPGSGSSIKEDYLTLCVGLTFNANWFNKWKIE